MIPMTTMTNDIHAAARYAAHSSVTPGTDQRATSMMSLVAYLEGSRQGGAGRPCRTFAPNAVRRGRSFGDAVFIFFLLAQGCDGALTYMGVNRFGLNVEANPVVAWYVAALGVGTAMIAVKTVAAVCGALLHLLSWHRTIGLLTVLYLAAAVWPWTKLLFTVAR